MAIIDDNELVYHLHSDRTFKIKAWRADEGVLSVLDKELSKAFKYI